MNLRNYHGCDVNSLKIRPVKYVTDLISPFFDHIYNKSLLHRVLKNMQRADDKTKHENYHPISIFLVFSKAREKIIHFRITNILNKHSVISEAQFEYKNSRSTELALPVQKEVILYNFENKMLILGVCVDFSKAFDCIIHNTLLDKLFYYMIRGAPATLIKPCPSSRSQYVALTK